MNSNEEHRSEPVESASEKRRNLIREILRRTDSNPNGRLFHVAEASELSAEEAARIIQMCKNRNLRTREGRTLFNILEGLNHKEAEELAIIVESMPHLSPAQNLRFSQLVYQKKGLPPEDAGELALLQQRREENTDRFYESAEGKAYQEQYREKMKDKTMPNPKDSILTNAQYAGFSQHEIDRLHALETIIIGRT